MSIFISFHAYFSQNRTVSASQTAFSVFGHIKVMPKNYGSNVTPATHAFETNVWWVFHTMSMGIFHMQSFEFGASFL